MRRIILGIALLVLASGLWKTYSVRVHQSSSRGQMTDPTLLSNRIKKAKAGGITEVVIPAPVPYLAEVSSLDEAVTHYSVIVGEAIDATSIQVDGSNIMTYYRFRILERLSDRGGPFGGVPEEFPRALAPLGSE